MSSTQQTKTPRAAIGATAFQRYQWGRRFIISDTRSYTGVVEVGRVNRCKQQVVSERRRWVIGMRTTMTTMMAMMAMLA
jgi:hypothetical protein